jgi:hypothetical protein
LRYPNFRTALPPARNLHDRYEKSSHERGGTLGELYKKDSNAGLGTLEKLHRVVVEERRFIQLKNSQRARSALDLALRFAAPVVVTLATLWVTSLLSK